VPNLTEPIVKSELSCPHCDAKYVETMPTDACIYFYECKGCGVMIRPKTGDCCVFCSYGSQPCPPIQIERAGGASNSCCRS
jgi:hypothetical protein